jgi:two-component system, cell cycle sensor histidine kinase and response regulator CckA
MGEDLDENSRVCALEEQVASLQRAFMGAGASTGDAPSAADGGGPTSAELLLERVLRDQSVLENLPDIVTIIDRAHRILYLNRTVPGLNARDVVGTSALAYIPESEHAGYCRMFEQAWQTATPCSFEQRTVGDHWWESRFIPVQSAGVVSLMLGVSADVTQRKHAERALRESESRLREALDATGMGTWAWTAETEQFNWDAVACALFGVDPARPQRSTREFIELVHADDRARVREALARCLDTGNYDELVHRVVLADGAVRHVLSKGTVIHDSAGQFVGVRGGILDISHRKRLEEQLNQSAKMEAIGQLTAGVAHNFNNLLSVIVPNVGLARFSTGSELALCLDDIDHAARRATDLVKQLMLFARTNDAGRHERVDLVALVQRSAQFCRTTFRRTIAITLEQGEAVPEVAANVGQIEQLLLNICLNARDAFEDAHTPLPSIVIRVEATAAGAARVCVTDNGPGMDEATRSRVFEPFFTTKAVGRGTGLGLASVYAIVAEHGGQIDCQSERGVGTCFSVVLPRAGQGERPAWPVASAPITPLHGSETVLLVEDEPLVRKSTSAMLALGGYGVVTANDGQQAIELLSRQPHGVDIVLLDGSMPGPPSQEVAARLRQLDSRVPLLLLSGNPDATFPPELVVGALTKPVDANTLFRAIRRALDQRGAR